MKKFKFRLERVLDYRERIKEERERELAMKLAEQTMIEEKLEILNESTLAQMLNEGGVYSGAELAQSAHYKQRLKDETIKMSEKLEEAKKAVEEARANYIEASRDTQALEKLKEKKKEEYQEQVSKAEIDFIDEITSQRVFRRKGYEKET